MVAWPLRSTQNKGTGTTAYSLGGFGFYNGTLTNGPTWGTGGITFDGTNDYITTGLTSGFSEFTALSVATPTISSSAQWEFAKDAGATREWAIVCNNLLNFSPAIIFNPTQTNLGSTLAYQTTIRLLCLRASSSVAKYRRNNESDFTGTVGTLNQSSSAVGIGSRNGGNNFKGIIHSSIIFNKALTDSETSSIYTLYSTTLGSGLGLP
jgi:hypothetical protein